MIPSRFAPIAFAFILSGVMSFIVSSIAIIRTTGWESGLFGVWIGAWLTSWLVAFPTVLFVAPFARRIVAKMVKNEHA
jgi:hypothetical protein